MGLADRVVNNGHSRDTGDGKRSRSLPVNLHQLRGRILRLRRRPGNREKDDEKDRQTGGPGDGFSSECLCKSSHHCYSVPPVIGFPSLLAAGNREWKLLGIVLILTVHDGENSRVIAGWKRSGPGNGNAVLLTGEKSL